MRKVKGIILCGGTGTRFRPITYYFQKAMIPIGFRQKPLLEYVVRLFKFHDIENLVFLVDYKAQQITNYFGDGSRFGVRISYVHDVPTLKGTAGSTLNALQQGIINKKDTLFIYYGDIVTTTNLKDMLNFHIEKKASTTIALSSGFVVRVGLADLDKNGKLYGFVEKPKLDKPVSIGLIVMKGEMLIEAEELSGDKDSVDLMKDVLPCLIKKDKPVYGYLSEAFWLDVGSIEAYEKLDHRCIDKIFSYLFK